MLSDATSLRILSTRWSYDHHHYRAANCRLRSVPRLHTLLNRNIHIYLHVCENFLIVLRKVVEKFDADLMLSMLTTRGSFQKGTKLSLPCILSTAYVVTFAIYMQLRKKIFGPQLRFRLWQPIWNYPQSWISRTVSGWDKMHVNDRCSGRSIYSIRINGTLCNWKKLIWVIPSDNCVWHILEGGSWHLNLWIADSNPRSAIHIPHLATSCWPWPTSWKSDVRVNAR